MGLILSIVAITYTAARSHRRLEVDRLRTDNIELAEVNQELEATIAEVQGRLDEFEERTSRLALAADEAQAVGFRHREKATEWTPAVRSFGWPLRAAWGTTANSRSKGTSRNGDGFWLRRQRCTPSAELVADGFGRRKIPSPAVSPSTAGSISPAAVARRSKPRRTESWCLPAQRRPRKDGQDFSRFRIHDRLRPPRQDLGRARR